MVLPEEIKGISSSLNKSLLQAFVMSSIMTILFLILEFIFKS